MSLGSHRASGDGLRSRRKVLWIWNRVALNRVFEERSWRFGSNVMTCNGNHELLIGWSRRSGVRNATMSIRDGWDLDDGFSSL